jgi:hypothetical protein
MIIRWWIRSRPKDVMFVGPVNVGPTQENPANAWLQLMDEEQIAKTTGNNMTCSFFLYVNSASINRIPVNYDGSYKFNYLLEVGRVLGVTVNPANQTCSIDVLQSTPNASFNFQGTTIERKVVDGATNVRTLEVPKVLVSRWNQLTICVEGRTVDVYLNGKLATSAVLDNVPARAFSGLRLNRSPDFEGQACLFQMWKERRSGQQILENYQRNSDIRGKPLVPDPELTFSGAWDRFLKVSCETTGFCGFPVKVGPMEYVEYEFA